MTVTTKTIYTADNAPSWAEIRALLAQMRIEDEERRRADEKLRRAEEERRRAEEERLRVAMSADDAKRKAANDRMLRELGRKIAGLGDKFGYFTEGMALPSMEKILKRQFGITKIAPRMQVEQDGRNLEFDVFGYSTGDPNRVVIVEIKSRVEYDAIKQLGNQIHTMRDIMPEHRDKEVIGILAGVHWDPGIDEQARKAGFHTARIRNDVFTLTSPPDFKPTSW